MSVDASLIPSSSSLKEFVSRLTSAYPMVADVHLTGIDGHTLLFDVSRSKLTFDRLIMVYKNAKLPFGYSVLVLFFNYF